MDFSAEMENPLNLSPKSWGDRMEDDNEDMRQALFDHLKIEASEQPLVKIVEIQDLLHLTYKGCSSDTNLRSIRGLILDKDTFQIVCPSTPYTVKVSSSKKEKIRGLFDGVNISEVDIHPMYEGTIIKVYYHKDVMYVSTQNMIDAYESYWDSISFGKMFDDIIGLYKDVNFDKDTCYTLFMTHPSNRIVCRENKKCLYFIDSYHKNPSELEDSVQDASLGILPECITRQENIHVESVDELIRRVNRLDITKSTGYIIKKEDDTYVQVVSSRYLMFKSIRGDIPNLYIRYLELRNTGTSLDRLQDFVNMYPDKEKLFCKIESELRAKYMILYKLHEDGYSKKQHTTAIHSSYITLLEKMEKVLSKIAGPVTPNMIAAYINGLPAPDQWELIKDDIPIS